LFIVFLAYVKTKVLDTPSSGLFEFPRISILGILVNKGTLGGVAQVGMHARYQEVAVLTYVLFALEAKRSCY
jgi:hypothetical protein